jgi:ATP-dependent Clp protease adaptor protein ClpS
MSDSSKEKKSLVAIKKQVQPGRPTPRELPPWKVLLHNDAVNEVDYVVETITILTSLQHKEAQLRTLEAYEKGVSLLLTTHQERAELYLDQFTSKQLTVTIEPA